MELFLNDLQTTAFQITARSGAWKALTWRSPLLGLRRLAFTSLRMYMPKSLYRCLQMAIKCGHQGRL
ncbi:hypothetical protein KP509_06G023600 [Ceratopteris richardii]|uniref:Uncharacterized protein n=1 Tax=Ceratopteris richardii TaxID=49495 RepID=A0A8T2UL81_CERRI|nr:hypothetical protein KP509_06G023600 [Ceratopteris richardii]